MRADAFDKLESFPSDFPFAGDIGTSPLYALNGVFPSSGDVPSEQDVVGGVSAIIWAIILVPLIKYAVIGLEFGNDAGEGGPFAVYTALYPPPEVRPISPRHHAAPSYSR